jgi:single-stranded-DNA-specific exonuclease
MSDQTIPETEELLAYPPLLQEILKERGIVTAEEAQRFLQPEWERDTHDPFLMHGMERACERVLQAIEQQETIAIWSDYDMDGIPGAVALWDLFHVLGYKNVVHHTPHRNKDGFGLNANGLNKLKEDGVSLVITIDCGIADVEQVAHANTLGFDVIITDHHLPGAELPKAHTILNPKQDVCSYPEPMLCGAGVVFKFVQGFLAYLRERPESSYYTLPVPNWERWLLDMVGMATIADMVPLRGENRVFAYFGIVVLRKSRRPGLQALLKKARAKQRFLSEDDIGFTIAPRINAASRMGHAKDAFRLLTAIDETEAGALADELERINNARKGHVAAMVKEAKGRLASRTNLASVIVLGNPEWKPSLLGLVAGTLAEEYERPVFLWGREGGTTIKGSCRTYNGIDVHALMEATGDSFVEYGGHRASGGFSINEKDLFSLEKQLSDARDGTDIQSEVSAAGTHELSPGAVTWDTYRLIQKCAPFGEANPKPLFLIREAELSGVRTFGKGAEHLELQVARDSGPLKAIAFFTSADRYATTLAEGVTVKIQGHLEASYFMRSPELRLRIAEIN